MDMIYPWAPGAEKFILPENAGFRFGLNGYKSFQIQMHYDNPVLLSGKVDNSGLRLHYSTELREHDAGVMQIGDPFVNLMSLSPVATGSDGISQWDFSCPSSCTEKQFGAQQSVTVFGEYLHMHKSGIRMIQSHLRDGEVLKDNYVDYFDFDMAGAYSVVQDTYEVKAGDSFETSCIYQSQGEEVNFGLGSDEEMCITFLMYYPFSRSMFCGVEMPPSLNHCVVDYKSKKLEEEEIGRVFGTPCETNAMKPQESDESSPDVTESPEQSSTSNKRTILRLLFTITTLLSICF